MIFNSIRWRLQAWHGVILATVLTGFGVAAYQVARDNQLRSIDQDLGQQLEGLFRPRPPAGDPGDPPEARPPRGERGRPFPFESPEFEDHLRQAVSEYGSAGGPYLALWKVNQGLLARSPGAPQDMPPPSEALAQAPQAAGPGQPGFRPGPRGPMLARTRGPLREIAVPLPRGFVVVAGRSIADDQAAMQRLALWLLAAGLGVFLLGLAGGGWVAAHAIRPIDAISATAQRISAGDLSQRINVADTESELGRLAAVLNNTFARLESSFTQQARFTADASHELRTPVAVILTQTQTCLARERDSAEYKETLEACQRAAQRMRRLTESLLELARLDAGEEPMRRDRFDLGRVARESAELIRPLAAQRNVTLETDLALADCAGDAEHVGQVVTNLLSNAIHYNRDSGTVHVVVRIEGDHGVLRISDAGSGIAVEDQPHIFERFYRADKSRARAEGRTGLGLAICKAIVDAHGGSIGVESQPGSGSTFTVRLPLAHH
ncbi:sensor histidine kinase [Paludibaculum fermentans]|uniref:sensor histidine kinase n=1 Tax=Paludibaculum fermentans TaxID=1473598 RepID=UPI003EBD9714